MEEGLCGGRTQGSRGSFESSDVVVGGEGVRSRSAIDTIGLGRRERGTGRYGWRHSWWRVCTHSEAHDVSDGDGDVRKETKCNVADGGRVSSQMKGVFKRRCLTRVYRSKARDELCDGG